MNLNPEQQRAVETTEGPVLVLSGAGTGKTLVLVARIAHILGAGLARPWEVLAVTFTNKAANEMRERVRPSVGDEARDIWLGTFHSICLRILRYNSERAGLHKNFLVFGEDDQKTVLKTVLTNLGLDFKSYPLGEWVEKIQTEKDKGLKESGHDAIFNKIYSAYNAELTRLNAVDFGDLILKVLELFIDAPDVLQKYQNQFRYVMVDEYQDTNTSQYQLLRMLASGSSNICCVGDDDQSIYSWRGAEIKNILNFEQEHPGATIIRLETNYRSTPSILGASNSLIRHNTGRLGKELRAVPDTAVGEKVHVFYVGSEFEEARFIADSIEMAGRKGVAVLIRAGSLSRAFEEEFARRGISYRLVGATKFYDRMEIRDAIAYARLLHYPFDDISFMRIISKPRRGFGDVALQKIREHAAANIQGMLQSLREISLSGKQRTAADEFLAAFDFDWQVMEPAAAVAKLLEKSGYMKMWQESKEADAEDRLQNVGELLKNVIAKYDTLAEFLEHAALMTAEDDTDIFDAVPIMTIHAAKGLEFGTVFMPAWEEGIFPNEKAINDGGLEEERRLAYVALTRARRNAVILCAASRLVFGTRQHNPPSRFIGEIDPQFVKDNRFDIPSVKIRRSAAVSRVSTSMVGRLVSHPELGNGVVIEEGDNDIMAVAFKDKGIKKVDKRFLT